MLPLALFAQYLGYTHTLQYLQCSVCIIRGVARGGRGASAPTSAKRTDFFQKAHKNTRKFIHTNSTISTRCGNFDTSGSTDGHSTGFGVYVVTLRLADFTTSVLAGSLRLHLTWYRLPPKPKILATPLIIHHSIAVFNYFRPLNDFFSFSFSGFRNF